MWLYHAEYAASRLGAIEFYKRLGQYQKNTVGRMIRDIFETPKPRKKGRATK